MPSTSLTHLLTHSFTLSKCISKLQCFKRLKNFFGNFNCSRFINSTKHEINVLCVCMCVGFNLPQKVNQTELLM